MTRRRIAVLLAAMPLISALSLAAAPPAAAIIVFDPSNYASNVLQAARSLQQIVNQVSQLQNEAQMLIGQARSAGRLSSPGPSVATSVSANPADAELDRCRHLTPKQTDDVACMRAWAEQRQRFFGRRP